METEICKIFSTYFQEVLDNSENTKVLRNYLEDFRNPQTFYCKLKWWNRRRIPFYPFTRIWLWRFGVARWYGLINSSSAMLHCSAMVFSSASSFGVWSPCEIENLRKFAGFSKSYKNNKFRIISCELPSLKYFKEFCDRFLKLRMIRDLVSWIVG